MRPEPLDHPLPALLIGREHGWYTRYRRFPVFSAPWVRGRLRSASFTFALLMAGALAAMLAAPPADRPWPGLVEVALDLSLPWLLGPALALWVRRRGWPAEREWWGLVAAMALVVGAMVLFGAFGTEPLKQWVAERTGSVDERGQRQRLVIGIGVNISALPEGRPSADSASKNSTSINGTLDVLTRSLITFWLAGGIGLRSWRRERRGLADIAREAALAEAQAQRREAELRLSVLAAQVEPHFLFNTLAGVRSAIATDPARASEMIDRLVDYLRAAIPRLRHDGSALATVGAQFEIVRAYLGLMAARMPRLQVTIDCEPALLKARCPPLMLISLAENAVKHGVEPKIGAAQISVRAERRDDGRLDLVVEDDGVGFGVPQAGSGLGLSNIRARLAELYGDAGSLTLKARAEGGVSAVITVPLEMLE